MLLDSIRTQLDSLSKSERKVALGCRKIAAHHIALAKAGAHSTLINFGCVDDVTNIKYPMLLDSIRTQLDSLSKSERKVALGCRKIAAHHIALAKAGAHSTLINFGSVEWVPAFARTM